MRLFTHISSYFQFLRRKYGAKPFGTLSPGTYTVRSMCADLFFLFCVVVGDKKRMKNHSLIPFPQQCHAEGDEWCTAWNKRDVVLLQGNINCFNKAVFDVLDQSAILVKFYPETRRGRRRTFQNSSEDGLEKKCREKGSVFGWDRIERRTLQHNKRQWWGYIRRELGGFSRACLAETELPRRGSIRAQCGGAISSGVM